MGEHLSKGADEIGPQDMNLQKSEYHTGRRALKAMERLG